MAFTFKNMTYGNSYILIIKCSHSLNPLQMIFKHIMAGQPNPDQVNSQQFIPSFKRLIL